MCYNTKNMDESIPWNAQPPFNPRNSRWKEKNLPSHVERETYVHESMEGILDIYLLETLASKEQENIPAREHLP